MKEEEDVVQRMEHVNVEMHMEEMIVMQNVITMENGEKDIMNKTIVNLELLDVINIVNV